jgi:hypothetical protein
MDAPKRTCRHCHRRAANRARGLCFACHSQPAVRALYPPTSPTHRRGVPDTHSPRPLPATATTAGPGSRAKVAVLEQRAAQRLTLWHDDDAAESDERRTKWHEDRRGGGVVTRVYRDPFPGERE